MTDNKWAKRAKPFSEIDEWTTNEGFTLHTGDNVAVKPTYVKEKLPAKVEKIYFDPQGLPGGKFDHRGKQIGKPDYSKENPGEYKYEKPDQYDCILTVMFRFDIPDNHEYSHLDGKSRKVEGYNLDFCVDK